MLDFTFSPCGFHVFSVPCEMKRFRSRGDRLRAVPSVYLVYKRFGRLYVVDCCCSVMVLWPLVLDTFLPVVVHAPGKHAAYAVPFGPVC